MLSSRNIIIIFTIVLIIATTATGQDFSHPALRNKVVKNKQVIMHNVYRIFSDESKVATISYPEKFSGLAQVILFSNDGSKLWEMSIERANRVSFAKNTDDVIVTSMYNMRDERINTLYDYSGNKIWENWITDPGLTMSDDGKYGITTEVSGEEGKGSFQIFDLSTGKEIAISFGKDYQHFYAKFLDNDKVIILSQKVIYTRILPIESRRSLFDRVGGRKDGETDKEFRARMRRERKKRGPTFKSAYEPLDFRIFDIPSAKVIIHKRLTSVNGDPIWTTSYTENQFLPLKEKQFIILAVNTKPKKARPIPGPHALVKLNLEGEKIWENNQFKYIKSIELIDQNKIIVIEPPSKIHLIDNTTGETIWIHEHHKKVYGKIQYSEVTGDSLIIQTDDASSFTKSSLHILEMATGKEVIEKEYQNNFVVLRSDHTRTLVYDKLKSELLFLK